MFCLQQPAVGETPGDIVQAKRDTVDSLIRQERLEYDLKWSKILVADNRERLSKVEEENKNLNHKLSLHAEKILRTSKSTCVQETYERD